MITPDESISPTIEANRFGGYIGLTQRDYLAAQAMPTVIREYNVTSKEGRAKIAEICYLMADAVILESKKSQDNINDTSSV